MTKMVFFGTNSFAAFIFQKMIESGLFEIVLVVTKPDRPAGRGRLMKAAPVKTIAQKNNIPIIQPANLKNFFSPLLTGKNRPPIGIAADYGLIIPKDTLSAFPLGIINVHPSLLPKYRGASPIQSALLNGENSTGVSIILLDDKMDHGPILAQEETPIAAGDDFASLSERLSTQAAALLANTAPRYLHGKINPLPQNDSKATYCKIFTRGDGKIDFNKTAGEIYNMCRGLSPWPGLWTSWDTQRLKILLLKPAENPITPGAVKFINGKIFIGCANGSVEIKRLQLEGKKPMTAKNFINGHHNFQDAVLK